MGKLQISFKKIILLLSKQGHSGRQIAKQLYESFDIQASPQAINKFLLQFKIHRSLERKPGSGRRSIITPEMSRIIEAKMQCDDETTATQLQTLLQRSGYNLSLSTLRRCRRDLGWTFHGSKYCQMVREVNKIKRLEWCRQVLQENDDFHDVIWTDETSVQLESHRRHSFRKKNQPPKLKPRPKHPVKVHVWAGISKRGATKVCIFEGRMDADFYLRILSSFLLPFIVSKFPSTHRFMQDNDPKHTSLTRKSREFFEHYNVHWWRTPPESPDLNPIENVWHEMKEYLRREVKPSTKSELIEGIKLFWSTVDTEKCVRYIQHLDKVIPKAIDCSGSATGY